MRAGSGVGSAGACMVAGGACFLAITAGESTANAVAGGMAVFAGCTMIVAARTMFGALSLPALSMVALAAYSLAVPLHHLFFDDYPDRTLREGLVLCCIAAAGQAIGTLAGRRLPRRGALPATGGQPLAGASSAGLLVIVAGVACTAAAIQLTVGFDRYLAAGYAGRALLKREAGPIELGLYWAVVGCVLWALGIGAQRPGARRRLAILALGAACAGFVAFVSMLGIRRPSFFLAAAMLVAYLFSRRRPPGLGIAALAVCGAMAFGLFASFRQVLSDHDVSATVDFVGDRMSLDWLDLSTSEVGAPFRALLAVLTEWSGEPWRCGWTYVQALNVAPKGVLSLGDALSVEYTYRCFSEDYIAIGGNMGFFPVAEGQVNFGALGVFGEFLFVGAVIGALETMTIRRRGLIVLSTYCIVVPWYVFFLRTDLASFTKSASYSIVPALALGWGWTAFVARRAADRVY